MLYAIELLAGIDWLNNADNSTGGLRIVSESFRPTGDSLIVTLRENLSDQHAKIRRRRDACRFISS